MLNLEMAISTEIDDLSTQLTVSERELFKITLFKRERDLFLLGRIAAKRALQGFLGTTEISNHSILPSGNESIPYKVISNVSKKELPIKINMAQAGEIAVACVHPAFSIGIEIEILNPHLTRSHLNKQEMAFLDCLDGEAYSIASNLLLTAKKSVVGVFQNPPPLNELVTNLPNNQIIDLMNGRQNQLDFQITNTKTKNTAIAITQFLHFHGKLYTLSFAIKEEEYLFFQKTDFSMKELRLLLSMAG